MKIGIGNDHSALELKAEIVVHQGDILKIDSRGKRSLSRFDDTKLCMRDYCRYYGLADWYWPASPKKVSPR